MPIIWVAQDLLQISTLNLFLNKVAFSLSSAFMSVFAGHSKWAKLGATISAKLHIHMLHAVIMLIKWQW